MSEQSIDNHPRAVIVTAIVEECLAVQEHLGPLSEVTHEIGSVYTCGTFVGKTRTWQVGIVQTGAGNVNAALEVERAIGQFHPQVIMFIGIAGGIKDVSKGDVVAATKIYGYESGKAKTTFHTRPELGNSSYALVQRASAEASRSGWLQRIKGDKPQVYPKAFVNPIAAGEQLVASTVSQIYRFLQKEYGDALAVEMEGYGFLKATHAHPEVQSLVVRGISDLLDGKSETDAQNWQQRAARNASAFAFEVLAKYTPPVSGANPSQGKEEKPGRGEKASKYSTQFYGTVHNVVIGDQNTVTNNDH